MNEDILDQWERDFRASALADDYTVFRDHLRRLDLPDNPLLMLEGTILFVRMCSAYAVVDERDDKFDAFLAMQTYDPTKSIKARYAYTFDIFGKAFGRLYIDTKAGTLDLADLYGSPWNDYEVVGFHRLWISHPDWSPLTGLEWTELESVVSDDLRFDYTEDEIEFWFPYSPDETYLCVIVEDVCLDEDEIEA
jgi:hypothetical protein